MNKRILITGGCGFIGSTLAILLKKKYPQYTVVVLDNLKRRGSELNISRIRHEDIEFIHGDIRNHEDFDQVGKIDTLIEASAEPSVLAGRTSSAEYLINTNLLGTVNCLNFAVRSKADMLFLSTSRVYPYEALDAIPFVEGTDRFSYDESFTSAGISNKGISERFPLEGARSLYGATKLASELLITEYRELYGLKAVINRCGVVSGPYQMGKIDQGIVVLWLAAHYWNRPLTYIGYGGYGKQVRDVLHSHDLFDLVDLEIHDITRLDGMTMNVGGGVENGISLKELTTLCEEITGRKLSISTETKTRPADVRIYVTDNSLVTRVTGWRPMLRPERIIEDIYSWIRKDETNLVNILT